MNLIGHPVLPMFAAAALLAGAASSAFADGHFEHWRHFITGQDGTKAYYYAASVKPIRHIKTGQVVGMHVWAGWQNPNGTYNKGRYSVYCDMGTYDLEGDVNGAADGTETSGDAVLGQPYQPESFVDALASVVCRAAK
jgi:hypothetical protein